MRGKPILSLDFDGVCHSYTSPWVNSTTIPDPPVPGLYEFLKAASEHFIVQIYSTRSETRDGRIAMKEWVFNNAPREDWGEEWNYLDRLEFPSTKPKAFVGLDDRVLTFEGKWPELATLINWKPWNKRG